MWVRYLVAIVGISLVLMLWAWVQGAWRKTFESDTSDEDVLAGRMSCSGCSCGGGSCKTGTSDREGSHASV